MENLPKCLEIKEIDKAYFAGLFDGEGTVRIFKNCNKKYIGYSLRVSFDVTYKSVLLRLQKLFSGNICIKDMEKRKNCKSIKKSVFSGCSLLYLKQVYAYTISGKDALYFLKLIEPYCDEKKQQVIIGIKFEEGRQPRAGGVGRNDLETERCEFFYKELQRLKCE